MKTKKNILTKLTAITLFLISIISCEKEHLTEITGTGPVVSENINIEDINGIITEIPANVYITKGDEQSIKIEAQQNILDHINRTVENNSLKLWTKEAISTSESIEVYMTVKDLDKIDLRGAGDIVSDSKFDTEGYLKVIISGSGNVDLEADASNVELLISGAGEINLKTNCENILANLTGAGNIKLNGSTKKADYKMVGTGAIYAFDFPTEKCSINSFGIGDIKISVINSLSVNLIGSGNVYYIGAPLLSLNTIGTGNIINSN